MAYKKKEKVSLLLYYDYIQQFELLDDKQLRKLLYAMIEFDKNEIEPKLDKITNMAFIPIKRKLIEDKQKWEEICLKNSENIRKRWEKEKNTSEYECIRMDTKNTDKDIEKEKDKEKDIEIDKDIDIDLNINNNINKSVCVNKNVANATSPTPTLDEIIEYGKKLNVDKKYCKKFFNNYESVGWVATSGRKIKNWKAKFEQWIEEDNIEKKEEQKRYL